MNNYLAARLGEARLLFFIGIVLAAIGLSCMAGAALLRPAPQQGGWGRVLLPYRNYVGVASPPDCYELDAKLCRVLLTRESTLQKLATTLGTTMRELRRLNPSAANRLASGSSLVVRACSVARPETCARGEVAPQGH